MIKLQITNPQAFTRNWFDKTTGLPRSMRIQSVLVYLPDSEGKTDTYDKIEMILSDKQNPFDVGFYTLTPSCVYLDRNNRMQLGLSNIQAIQQKSAS